MKSFIVSAAFAMFAMFATVATAQTIFPVDTSSGKISYDSVIISTLTKEALYKNATEWFATEFNSGKDVIQLSDPESGKIIGKGNIPHNAGYLSFQITILVKDQKYKYEITNFYQYITEVPPEFPLEAYFKPGTTNIRGMSAGISKKMDAAILDMIKSLNKAMAKSEEKKW